jgi:hypothetical protein
MSYVYLKAKRELFLEPLMNNLSHGKLLKDVHEEGAEFICPMLPIALRMGRT